MADGYHHGNLKQALIEAGMKLINEYGEEALSLRKVAAFCGVSHAAPYAHFKNKEELLDEIKVTAANAFARELEDAIHSVPQDNPEAAIMAMGKRYVLFFRDNPDYFSFLFQKQKMTIHLPMTQEHPEDYPLFLKLKQLFREYLVLNHIQMDEQTQELELLKTWAIVQGLSSIAVMKDVHMSFQWEDVIEGLLRGN